MNRLETARSPRFLACIALGVGLDAVSCAQSSTPGTSDEPRFRYSALDNGDFTESNTSVVDAHGVRPIPWWRSTRGLSMVAPSASDPGIGLGETDWVEQPIPAYAPLAEYMELSGIANRLDGASWSVTDGAGTTRTYDPHFTESRPDRLTFPLTSYFAAGPIPRCTLRLTGRSAFGAVWASTRVEVDLPCPSEAALRAEIVDLIEWIFATWFERGIDDVGPRKTGFLAKNFDAVTGESLFVAPTTGFSSVYQALFDALEVEEVPAWRARFDRLMEDYLALQLQPETGLPRNWDPTTDAPDERSPVEIALPFGFLLDVAERGTERFRARAGIAAKRIGEAVLARGLLPDGNCAASYVPKDGAPNTSVSQLRRLDVPLQLVRLSKLLGDPRYAKAAREPLAALEFTNSWAGTWDAIDPGFDDDFGHYGARATRIARVDPGQALYRRFALEGWNHYAPIWRDALRFGGNIAADQVRCWKIGVDLAHVDPSLRAEMGPLLRLAARSHFKGEQYGNGAWGDVTIFDFSPKATLQVGDLPGAPQNLLQGLAFIYVDDLGLRTDEIRAMYTAVLRSSVAQYKRPYGFLVDRTERKGANSAYGSVRVLTGLVEMLRALSPRK